MIPPDITSSALGIRNKASTTNFVPVSQIPVDNHPRRLFTVLHRASGSTTFIKFPTIGPTGRSRALEYFLSGGTLRPALQRVLQAKPEAQLRARSGDYFEEVNPHEKWK